MKKTGHVNLPLHSGHAPRWLFKRMVRLAGQIVNVIIEEQGQKEFINRISDPYWFQGFSCVLGFDWHSSGTTTTTCGALKQAIDPQETGICIAGGKGAASRKTPEEIAKAGELFNLGTKKTDQRIYASKITAKTDNTCIQDSYQLYHHVMVIEEKGSWAVVQQGMNNNYARRYHWNSNQLKEFVEEPHTGICCDHRHQKTLNMTSSESQEAREISLDLVKDGPQHIKKYLRKKGAQKSLMEYTMPQHHPVLDMDIGKRGMRVLEKAYEIQPGSFEELLSLKGMGPKKIRALALISDLVYGSKASWRDPVKYSFSHGGKDGYPYPVNKQVYDNSIETLKQSLKQAQLGRKDKLYAIKRLHKHLA